MLEAYTSLGFIAAHTSRARLGALVTGVIYRYPGILVGSEKQEGNFASIPRGWPGVSGLAQALINNPDLILLDEPTTGLDPIGTREMKDLIVSLKNQGKTVLLCSHLLADVQDVCDRITILFRGKMQTLGEVKDLLQVKDITQVQPRD